MERPYHFVPFLLNTTVHNVYYYKAKAENYLRTSGLNYTILRPPQMTNF